MLLIIKLLRKLAQMLMYLFLMGFQQLASIINTQADTLTVETPEELDLCLATWAVTAYVLSDISVALPRNPSSEPYLIN